MVRMRSSSSDMRRAVNARETSLRRVECLGGSVQIIIPVSTTSGERESKVVPWAELNPSGSLLAASMSWNRLSTQKS